MFCRHNSYAETGKTCTPLRGITFAEPSGLEARAPYSCRISRQYSATDSNVDTQSVTLCTGISPQRRASAYYRLVDEQSEGHQCKRLKLQPKCHSYPKSDKRSAERLGRCDKTFGSFNAGSQGVKTPCSNKIFF